VNHVTPLIERQGPGVEALAVLSDLVEPAAPWPALTRTLDRSVEISAPAQRWLAVAVTHKSWLYENSVLMPGVGISCLALFADVGKAALDLALREVIMADQPTMRAGQLHGRFVELLQRARPWLIEALETPAVARFGRGEQAKLAGLGDKAKNLRSHEDVMWQVLGWISVVCPTVSLTPLVRRAVNELGRTDETQFDWRTSFEQTFGGPQTRQEVETSGPDHALQFRVKLITADGRAGIGEASSKRLATRFAARDYLRRHAPQVAAALIANPPRTPLPPPVRLDTRATAALMRTFGGGDLAIFGRALTHRSWVKENTPNVDLDLASNTVLTQLGNAVLVALASVIRARTLLTATSDPDPDEARALTLPDELVAPLAERLGIARLVRLGRGQAASGLSVQMASGVVKAVLAAAYLRTGHLSSLEHGIPTQLKQFLTKQARIPLLDPFSKLWQVASEIQAEVEVEDEGPTGPDHRTEFEARITLTRGAERVELVGRGPGKSEARKAAAATLFAAVEKFAAANPLRDEEKAWAHFVARGELGSLAGAPARWSQWRRQGRVGAALLADGFSADFERWANSAAKLYEPPDSQSANAFMQYYRPLVYRPRSRPLFASGLRSAVEAVQQSANSADVPVVSELLWSRVVSVTTAQSVWLASDNTADLGNVLADCEILSRGRMRIDWVGVRPELPCSARAAAAFRYALNHVISADSCTLTVRGEQSAAGASVVCLRGATSWRTDEAFLAMIIEAADELKIALPASGDVEISAPVPFGQSNWLSARVSAAANETDAYDAELGAILHDLKNELTAVRAASAVSYDTRTGQLAAALAASRHWDAAAGLVARIADADLLFGPVETGGPVNLSEFFREYIAQILRRTPGSIRIVPPVMSTVQVDLPVSLFRTVVDNLVINATQAIGDAGGEIRIDYEGIEGDDSVVVRIGNTGPRIPDSVLRDLRLGRRLSGHGSGSGLGLHSVQRILFSVGGSLESAPQAAGHCWVITLPMFQAERETA